MRVCISAAILFCRMMDDNIKIFYNAGAKSYIIKKIEFDEYFNRKLKTRGITFVFRTKTHMIVKEAVLYR